MRSVSVTDSAIFTTPGAGDEGLGELLLEVLPPDGSSIGNLSAREDLGKKKIEAVVANAAEKRL